MDSTPKPRPRLKYPEVLPNLGVTVQLRQEIDAAVRRESEGQRRFRTMAELRRRSIAFYLAHLATEARLTRETR